MDRSMRNEPRRVPGTHSDPEEEAGRSFSGSDGEDLDGGEFKGFLPGSPGDEAESSLPLDLGAHFDSARGEEGSQPGGRDSRGWSAARSKVLRQARAATADKKESAAGEAGAAAQQRSVRLDEEEIDLGALYVDDGLHHRLIGYSTEPDRLAWYRFFHSWPWRTVYLVAATLHVCMALLEQPSGSLSSAQTTENYVLASVEWLILLVYGLDLWLIYRCFGYRGAGSWTRARLFVFVLEVADLVVSLATGFAVIRFSRPVRPVMLIGRFRNVRRVFTGFLKVVPDLIPAMVIMSVVVLMYAFAGHLLFWDVEGTQFDTFGRSAYAMLLCTTTAAVIPDTFLLVYERSEWSAIFFGSFIILVVLFVLRLIVAVAYSSYRHRVEAHAHRARSKRHVALLAAFRVLSRGCSLPGGAPGVTVATWLGVYDRLRGTKRLYAQRARGHRASSPPESLASQAPGMVVSQGAGTSPADPSSATGRARGRSQAARRDSRAGALAVGQALFEAVDDQGAGVVGQQGFVELCEMLDFEVAPPLPTSRFVCVNRLRRALRGVFGLSVLVGSLDVPVTEVFMSGVVVVSEVQAYMLAGPTSSASWDAVGVMVLAFFWLDTALQVFAYGFRRYWSWRLHRVDVACNVVGTVYLVVTWVMDPGPYEKNPAWLYSVASVARVLRLVKIGELAKTSKTAGRAVTRVLEALLQMLLVLFSLLYLFASLGEDFYSDSLRATNPRLGSDNEDWVRLAPILNFEGFHSAFMTLLLVAVIANWQWVMNAAVAVTSPASYAMFFSFRVLFTMVFLPIFAGWVIESFITQYQAASEEVEREGADRDQLWRKQEEARRNVMAASALADLVRTRGNQNSSAASVASATSAGAAAGAGAGAGVDAKMPLLGSARATHSEADVSGAHPHFPPGASRYQASHTFGSEGDLTVRPPPPPPRTPIVRFVRSDSISMSPEAGDLLTSTSGTADSPWVRRQVRSLAKRRERAISGPLRGHVGGGGGNNAAGGHGGGGGGHGGGDGGRGEAAHGGGGWANSAGQHSHLEREYRESLQELERKERQLLHMASRLAAVQHEVNELRAARS